MAGAAVVMAAVGFGYTVASWHASLPPDTFGFRGFNTILALQFAATGSILAIKRPANPIGWLFLLGALFAGLNELSDGYAIWSVAGRGSTTTLARLAAMGEEWLWIVAFTMLSIVLAVFPDGRPLSRRWKRVLAVALTGTAVSVIAYVLTDSPSVFKQVDNPLAVPGMAAVANTAIAFFFLLLIAGFANLIIRFRRTSGEEHEQLKWLAASTAFLVVAFGAYLLGFLVSGADAADTPAVNVAEGVLIVGLCTVPISIAIAILKYRLYDIDVVIKKTVIFAMVAGAATVLYLLVAVLVPTAIIGLGSGLQTWAVLIGVAIGLSILPIRDRVRRFADRLVYGKRATPYEVLEEFSGRMSGAYATDDVLPRMARILGEAVGAERAEVWLRIGDELRSAGRWPADAAAPAPVRIVGDGVPTLSGDVAAPVLHQGELLGALDVAMPANDPMNPERERLIHGLAAQAGLVLRNARLIEELRASRQRLVAAQDEERRKIERNIHDGAQQQLVALAVRQRLAASLIGKDDDAARRTFEELQTRTSEALEDLRDLARGIYPPLLADKGLPAALEAQARKSLLPVTIDPDGVGRYPQQIESAVYFSVLEALQNVAKYAEASTVVVTLAQSPDGHLRFAVADDGRGFDPHATGYGTGLQGIADRLAVLDGALDVQSTPGGGTTVAGRVPVALQHSD
jgi:signal transduction histidine kinase